VVHNMTNRAPETIPKEALEPLNQALYSYLKEPGDPSSEVLQAAVKTELATLSVTHDLSVHELFRSACQHGLLEIAASSIDPQLVDAMIPIMGTSQGLTGIDSALSKSKGYAARELLRTIAKTETLSSQTGMTSMANSLLAHTGSDEPNILVKNAIIELAGGVTSPHKPAYQMLNALRLQCEHRLETPAVLKQLNRSTAESLLDQSFDDDIIDLYQALEQFESSVEGNARYSTAAALCTHIRQGVLQEDFSGDRGWHLVELLLEEDPRLQAFKNSLMSRLCEDWDASDAIGLATAVGKLSSNSGIHELFNLMDASILAKGLKTSTHYENLSAISGVDLDRLNKRDLSSGALGSHFASELGL